jgi:hypothetical protein
MRIMDFLRTAGALSALLLTLSSSLSATVTYEGTNGVAATVFNAASYSSLACTSCHSVAGLQTPYLESWTDISTYGASNTSDFSCVTGYDGRAVTGFNYMANRVSCGEMPSGDDLDATGKTLFASWQSGGFQRWAAPTMATSAASSVSKYGATLNGTINENGSDATGGAFFRYSTSAATIDADGGTASTTTNPAGTGGGTASTAYNRTISGLSCGTTYYFKAWGTNGRGTSEGTRLSFTTSACPSITQGASVGVVMSEDSSPTPFSLVLNASESVTWSIFTQASNGTASVTAGAATSKSVSYTPSANYNGADSFIVRISDGTTTDDITVNVTINAVTDAPVISQGASVGVVMSEDSSPTPFSLNLNASDVDSGTLYWRISSAASNGTAGISGGTNSTSASGAAKGITYTPTADYTGSDSFIVQVSDGSNGTGLSDFITVNVTVNAVNDAPVFSVASPVAVVMSEDSAPTPFSRTLIASDVDNGTLYWRISSAASNGTAGISGGTNSTSASGASKSITYTPNANYFGSDSFIVQVSDGSNGTGQSAFMTVNVTINAINDAPTITSSPSTSGTEGVLYSYTATVNDPDDTNNGTALTWSLDQAPTGMTVSTTGLVQWTPPNGVTTADVTLRVADGGENGAVADTQSWTISLDAVNDPPVITSTAPTTATEDVQYSYQVAVSDPDDTNNGANLTFQLSNAPAGMVVSSTGLITWTPLEGVLSSGAVTVTVNDGGENGAGPDSEIFTVTVTPVNDAPQIVSAAVTTATEDTLYQYAVGVSDPDDANNGTALSWSLQNAPTGMSISSTGTISWTPSEGVLSSGAVTVRVQDGGENGALPATQTFTITVTPVNDPVTITSSAPLTATEDLQYSYQILVSDPDDANNGADINFALTSAPAGMAVSSTGLVTWTPANGVLSSGTVRVRVQDGLENGAVAAIQQWTVTVTPVNDAPVIGAITAQTVEELSSFSFAVQVTDPDDANNGTSLTWSLDTAPTGMTIGTTGIIAWTPGQNTAGNYPVTVRVADGGEDGASADTESFSIQVTLQDADVDGVADYEDNCPLNANADQADLDGDDIGNVCDPDRDGDGIPNDIEALYGLDADDAADAAADADGDGLSNLDEYNTCVADAGGAVLECEAIIVDSVGPLVDVVDIRTDQIAYLTEVVFTATANDGIDGPVTAFVTEINGEPVTATAAGHTRELRPGRYLVRWEAQDAAGNVGFAEQQVDILPLVTAGGARLAGRGQIVPVTLQLGGTAPSYPLEVEFVVSGTATQGVDYSLSSAAFSIANGTTATLDLEVIVAGPVQEDRYVDISLSNINGDAVLGSSVTQRVLIVDRQAAPEVALSAQQGGIVTRTIYADQGQVQIDALASDANGHVLTLDWQGSDPLLGFSGNVSSQTFDPSLLALGEYLVQVAVSDGIAVTEQSLLLVLADQQPVLDLLTDSDGDGVADAVEGFTDSDGDGIPDYLDNLDDPTLQPLLTTGSGPALRYAIATESGLTLTPGNAAMSAARAGVRVYSGELPIDSAYSVFGVIYDFEVHGLSEVNPVARVILPLVQPIPPTAVWRKHVDGEWQNFIETGDDRLASAMAADGVCPQFDAAEWQPGLLVGRDCLLLQLTDGGPNDADGAANGVIRDPAGVAVARDDPVDPAAPTTGPNSAGVIALFWWLMLVAPLWRRRFV